MLLTGTLGTWDGIGNAYAYQWQRSADGTTWTTITGATNPTYTLAVADEGAQIRVQVTATNADSSATASSSATAAVTGGKPVNVTPPTFAGAPQRAVRLAVTSNGNWAGIGNTLTRQWQRSTDGGQTWTNIAGQTDGSYTLTVADEGAQVRLLVTATNADGATGAPSAPSTTVTAAPALNMTAPVVTGTPQRSATLTASQGTWSGPDNTYGFQWQRSTDHGASWSNIPGATTSAYHLLAGDEGAIVRAQVTASNPDGTVTAASPPTSAIQTAPPVNLTPPTVTGTPQRTMTLTASQGTWLGADNTYIYQWQRSTDQGATWTPIVGANAVSYTLQTADENANIRVFITAANPDGGAGSPSPATPAIQPARAGEHGRAHRHRDRPPGRHAHRCAGDLDPRGGASFTYQWQRSTDTSTWTDIAGATSLTYTLGASRRRPHRPGPRHCLQPRRRRERAERRHRHCRPAAPEHHSAGGADRHAHGHLPADRRPRHVGHAGRDHDLRVATLPGRRDERHRGLRTGGLWSHLCARRRRCRPADRGHRHGDLPGRYRSRARQPAHRARSPAGR